jgi:hypothetical protein
MNIPPALATYMDGLRSHNIAKIGSSFASDIRFVTPVRTMQRDEILAFLGALYRAFPDWHYDNDPPFKRADAMIGVKWRQGGTHTGRIEFPGFPGVDATGRRVQIPEHHFYYLVDDEGLHEIRPDPVPGGAPRGIFEQIGVELPPL